MIPGNIVDGLLAGVLIVGAIIGLAFAGIIWLFVWLFRHIDITITWVP